MLTRVKKQVKTGASPFIYLKYGAILLLFAFSVLIVACSSGAGSSPAQLGGPVVTITIHLGDNPGSSPTPQLAPYWCGAWATQTSPAYGTNSVGVYAKFTQNVGGNPEGIGGATAAATVLWPDTSTTTQTVTTTSDGLAVFSISTTNKAFAINKITLVTVTFEKAGIPPCRVDADQAAFFTLVAASPSATGSPMGTPTGTAGGGPGTPTGTPPTKHPKPTPTRKPGN